MCERVNEYKKPRKELHMAQGEKASGPKYFPPMGQEPEVEDEEGQDESAN